MILSILLILIFVICVAMLWNEGTWSNSLTLINIVLAAMLATNYFEPAATFLESKLPSYTYLLDYLALWGIFFIAFSFLRGATDGLSKTQVRLKMPIEQAGRVVTSVAVGWVMICFTLTTLHTAPLAQTAVRGSFQAEPMSNNFLGIAPDRMWLGFIHSRSSGALSRSEPRVFDPQGDFIFKYGSRRKTFSAQEGVRVDRR